MAKSSIGRKKEVAKCKLNFHSSRDDFGGINKIIISKG
jgi:hypothetical protein